MERLLKATPKELLAGAAILLAAALLVSELALIFDRVRMARHDPVTEAEGILE